MKKQSLFLLALFTFSLFIKSFSQNVDSISSKDAIDSLGKRISELESTIKAQQEAQKLAENRLDRQTNQAYREQFNNAIRAIKSGLENGNEIEHIVPGTLRLLALKDLNETLNAINNPTSRSVGKPFSEMVIESASTHLLPEFQNEAKKQEAKKKFKSLLETIYNGPLVQGLLNSNPISSTINAAVQQAGFFEKNREPQMEITKRQIRDASNNNPIRLAVNTTNIEGPPFTEKEMKAFYDELAKRIEFYAAMNEYGTMQKDITQELYVDAKLIKKSVKASKSEICKLLEIDPSNANVNLSDKFDNLSIEQIKNYLNDPKFKKAVSLSDYAKEQLPEVNEFNSRVIASILEYIEGYKRILNKYVIMPEAKLDSEEVKKQIESLNRIKTTLESPVKQNNRI